jgi:hypothetical protein
VLDETAAARFHDRAIKQLVAINQPGELGALVGNIAHEPIFHFAGDGLQRGDLI